MFPFQFANYRDTFVESLRLSTPWTRRRLGSILFMYSAFPMIQGVNYLTLMADEVAFSDFRQVAVKTPLFLIGNPRSGTTFAHRLLNEDQEQLTTFSAYELLVLSISMQKLIARVARWDESSGSPGFRALSAIQEVLFRETDAIHPFRLHQPEGDEGVMINLFASLFLAMVFPTPSQERFSRFDELPQPLRDTLMGFYRECVQRHLYCHGGGRRSLLSKNPQFCAKIESLVQTFPDARFVYLVRSPYESIASTLSLVSKHWNMHLALSGQDPAWQGVIETLYYLYEHALETLDRLPSAQWIAVRYPELVGNPQGTAQRIYRHFGMTASPELEARWAMVAGKQAHYSSRHQYALDRYGLSRDAVYGRLKPVFERFDFDR